MVKQGEICRESTSSRSSASVKESLQNITGRILDSASSLLRDSLSSDSTQQTNTLTQVLAGEGKAGPSGPSSGTAQRTASEIRGGRNANQRLEPLSGAKNAFRNPALVNGCVNLGSADTAESMSLDQFVHSAQYESQVPIWQQSPTVKGKQMATRLYGFRTEQQASDAQMTAAWDCTARSEPRPANPSNTHMEAYGRNGARCTIQASTADGAEVVRLLQNPDAPPWLDVPEEPELPYTISEEDMRIVQEILRNTDLAMASSPGYQSAILAANGGESFLKFSSFFDNIDYYQDEVWGYLRPLVEEARLENAVPSSPNEEERPATRRLRMILSHVEYLR